MKIGARDVMGKARVKAFQPRWTDDVAMLIAPPWFLIIASVFLAAPSAWACAAFISGAVFLMLAARAKSAAMSYACAAVAWSRRRRD